MPELEPQATTNDPIGSLHKMSTTAGVGSTEYVQINPMAVASLILGLASALVLIFGSMFLILGAAGIVCGIVGLRQISHSAGTQGGRAIAWLGMLLSLVIAGGVGGNMVLEDRALEPDRRAINDCLKQVGERVSASQYKSAYDLFDPDFQMAWPAPKFETTWRFLQDPEFPGKVVAIRGNDIFKFQVIGDSRIVSTQALVRFEKAGEESRLSVLLRQQADRSWKILGFDLFQAPRAEE